MEKPLVSIVINNYNYGRFVRKAIESALSQTYNRVEIIIVDDGSTDESRTVIKEYIDRTHVLLKENGGQASAINMGITASKGKFLLMLDSDDYLYPEAVEVCVKAYPNGYSRVFYRMDIVDENNRTLAGKGVTDNYITFDGDIFENIVEQGKFPATPTSGNFFDADVIKSVLPIPEDEYKICADLYIFMKTPHFGPVCSINRTLAAYRVHRENNFCNRSKVFSEKRLSNQLDNYYKSAVLIEDSCKKAGYKYEYRIFEKDFLAINTLCASYVIKLDNRYLKRLTGLKLLNFICSYLKNGKEEILKKILQAIYLIFILIMPSIWAKYFVKIMHAWISR